MLFNKSKTKKEPRFNGQKIALDGHTAVLRVEKLASDAAGMFPVPNTAQLAAPLQEGALIFREAGSGRSVAGTLAGFSLVGLRSTTFTSGSTLAEMHESLFAAVGKRLSYVINLTCRAIAKHANTLHGGHDDYHAVADTGAFQMFAKNVQEAVDFALIAHRVAELALNPGIVAQDSYYTSHSVQTIQLPPADLVREFLGTAHDLIPTPTPAQKMIFGDKRRRIPEWFDLDRPLGIGTVHDQDSFFRAIAAQRPFFFDHVAQFMDQAMAEFAELTARYYQRASGYKIEDADYVIIAQGSVVEDAEAAADYLRQHEHIKAGVINLSVFRPFPGDLLTHFLKGKTAVTVLERVDQPLAEDLPLLREVRAAVDKALENGLRPQHPVYPDHAVYRHLKDRPQFYTGIYGIGGRNPQFGDLVATFRNMTPKGAQKRKFYLGLTFRQDGVRFPMLETLQQVMHRDYPGLDRFSLTGDLHLKKEPKTFRAFQLYSIAGAGGTLAGTVLARTLADAKNWHIRTYPEYGPNQSMQPTIYTILHSDEDTTPKHVSDKVDAILFSHTTLFHNAANFAHLKENGILLVQSEQTPDQLWLRLPDKVKRQVKALNARIYLINAQHILQSMAADGRYDDRLANQALIGAFFKVCEDFSADDLEPLRGHYRRQLEAQFGKSKKVIDLNFKMMIHGAEMVQPLDWQAMPDHEGVGIFEPAPPWTVKQVSQPDGKLPDLARFWDSVGYFYETAQPDQALPDPFVAAGVIPARSAAFRDMSAYCTQLPQIDHCRCTGCNLCWTTCPDMALPVTAQHIGSIIQTGIKACQARGESMIQLQRMADHLAKQAQKILDKANSSELATVDVLLQQAFDKLMSLMNLKGDQQAAIQHDFNQLRGEVAGFPFTSFRQGLLTIAVDPQACKMCGLCAAVCPENAIEMVAQTAERLESAQRQGDFLRQLPAPSTDQIEALIDKDDLQTEGYRLLNPKVYHSLIGGDGAFPGSGSKIAIHLVAAAIEAVMQPRIEQFRARLSDLVNQIELKLQGKMTHSLHINDFDLFGKKLAALEQKHIDPQTLVALATDAPLPQLDKRQLERLTNLRQQLIDLQQRYQTGFNGDGRARLAMALATGSVLFWGGTYPYNPFPFPWANQGYGDAAAVAEGLLAGIQRKMAETFKVIRQAELELDDAYRAAEHDAFFAQFSIKDFSPAERELCPPLLVVGGDGALGEAGFEAVSRLMASHLPVKIVLLDTQGFTATGGQSNGASFAARRYRREFGLLALMHRGVYVVQSSVGTPGHLLKGVRDAVLWDGPAVLNIYTPEPASHGIAPDQVFAQGRLAVESRTFPVFTYPPGQPVLNLAGNPAVESDLFNGLTFADFALTEARFRSQINLLPKQQWDQNQLPLADYLQLPVADRAYYAAYVMFTTQNGEKLRALLSPQIIAEIEDRHRFWRLLQELAGIYSPANEQIIEQAKREMIDQFEQEKAALIADYEAQLATLDQQHGQIYLDRLRRKLMAYVGNDPNFRASFREYLLTLAGNGDHT